jgi:hypothetical protein
LRSVVRIISSKPGNIWEIRQVSLGIFHSFKTIPLFTLLLYQFKQATKQKYDLIQSYFGDVFYSLEYTQMGFPQWFSLATTGKKK